jgi:hypothetical protein
MKKLICIILATLILVNFSISSPAFGFFSSDTNLIGSDWVYGAAFLIIGSAIGEHYLIPYLTDASLVKFKNEKSNYWGTFKGSNYFALPYLGVSLALFSNGTSEQSGYIAAGYVLMQILGGIWGNKNL